MSTATQARPRATIYMGISLDGRIADADGGLGWLDTVAREGEDYGFAAFMDGVDALVMGRHTYETVLGFGGAWPYGDLPVVVLSRSLLDTASPVPTVRFAAGEVADIAAELAEQGLRHLYVDGGDVARAFLAAGRCDTLVLSLVPVVLGGGPTLFGAAEQAVLPRSAWTLRSSSAFPSGLVQLRYRRAD